MFRDISAYVGFEMLLTSDFSSAVRTLEIFAFYMSHLQNSQLSSDCFT